MPRKTLEGRRKYRAENKDNIRRWVKDYRNRYKKRVLAYRRKRYVITSTAKLLERSEKRQAKLVKLAGRPKNVRCEICNKECNTVFDHCHKTGKFRGWLCAHCNRTIGFIETHPGLIYKMHVYIRNNFEELTTEDIENG